MRELLVRSDLWGKAQGMTKDPMAMDPKPTPDDDWYTIRYAKIVSLATSVMKLLSPHKKSGICSGVFQKIRRRLGVVRDFIRLENQVDLLRWVNR